MPNQTNGNELLMREVRMRSVGLFILDWAIFFVLWLVVGLHWGWAWAISASAVFIASVLFRSSKAQRSTRFDVTIFVGNWLGFLVLWLGLDIQWLLAWVISTAVVWGAAILVGQQTDSIGRNM